MRSKLHFKVAAHVPRITDEHVGKSVNLISQKNIFVNRFQSLSQKITKYLTEQTVITN